MSYKGTVQNGVVVLPPEAHLPEGATVDIIAQESPPEDVFSQSASVQTIN